MAKASELLSKLQRTSRRNDLVSAIAYDILERTKCDPNLLDVKFEDLDNDHAIVASFEYTLINGKDASIEWEEDSHKTTVDDDFLNWRYQEFIAAIINDVCNREEAKKNAQEELDRQATIILFRPYVEKLVEEFRKTGRCRELIEDIQSEPTPEPKSNPVLTQSQIEAIEKAGGIAIPDNEEVLTFHSELGGRTSLLNKHPASALSVTHRYIVQYNYVNDLIGECPIDAPIEAFNIPEEKIIAAFPPQSSNGPVYIAAPRGCEFWYRKTTFVHGDKKIPNLWLAICDGPRYGHDFTTPTRSAICLAIEAANNGSKNCSGPIR